MENKDVKNDQAKANDQDLSEFVAEAIAEVLDEAKIEVEPEERIVLANEVIEKLISPLMIQKAAGATSQVYVTKNAVGGVQNARSVKGRNARVNLKQLATAIPASLAGLASLYQKHPISGTITSALAAVYLLPLLKSIPEALKVPLTEQAAAILMVMWNSKEDDEETVPYAGLLAKVNSTFDEYKWNQISAEDLISHLEVLERIGSIERVGYVQSITVGKIVWRLKEQVTISY